MRAIDILQNISGPLADRVFAFFSFLGSGEVLIALVAIVYWCLDKKFSNAFVLSVVSGLNVNIFLKNVIRMQRPQYRYDYPIRVAAEKGLDPYSMPSAHAQNSAGVYWPIGKRLDGIFVLAAGMIVIAVSVSRMYRGLHTFWEVGVGAVIGILWSVITYKVYDMIHRANRPLYLFVFTIPSVLSLLSLGKLWFGENAEAGNTFMAAGLCFGAVAGLIIEHKYIQFMPQTNMAKQIVKVGAGLVSTVLLRGLLRDVFGHGDGAEQMIVYFILALWITVCIPLFAKYVLERWKIQTRES